MAKHKCVECPMRAKYDANPGSFTGRLWRWHIGFCPGWRAYFASLPDDKKERLRGRYNLKK